MIDHDFTPAPFYPNRCDARVYDGCTRRQCAAPPREHRQKAMPPLDLGFAAPPEENEATRLSVENIGLREEVKALEANLDNRTEEWLAAVAKLSAVERIARELTEVMS